MGNLMSKSGNEIEKYAWDVASDPTASEDKWIKAITVLDGSSALAMQKKPLPSAISLPWAAAVSSCGAIGSVVALAITQHFLCSGILNLFSASAINSYNATVMALWLAPCLVFSAMFTYQRLSFEGGKVWQTAQWTTIVGYLAWLTWWAMEGRSFQIWDAGLLIILNLSGLALATFATKFATRSFQAMNSTIGAKKLIVPLTRIYAGIPIMIAAAVLTTMLTQYYLPPTLFLSGLAALFLGGTFYTAIKLQATRTSTARSIATFIWGPAILMQACLLPLLAVTNIWLICSGAPMVITWADYVAAFAGLGLSIAMPLVCGTLAAKNLQGRAALELERGDGRRSIGTESDTMMPSLSATRSET